MRKAVGDKAIGIMLNTDRVIEYLWNYKNSIPYVPPSRCKAITSWYFYDEMQSLQNPSCFQQDLVEADKEVTNEAGYIISDVNVPSDLKTLYGKYGKTFGTF
jgi:hypothetical protein